MPTLISRLTNPCAAQIFKELAKGGQNLTNLAGLGALDVFPGMLDLFKKSGKFNYRIQNGITTGGANAETKRVKRLTIIFLNNEYLRNASSLSIARPIIHETVHAYLWEQTKIQKDVNALQLLNLYWKEYENSGDGRWPNTQHAAMSDYILGMAVSLYNWDRQFGPTQGTLGFDYYYKMAFGGLVEHNNPNNLIQEAKQYIPAGSSWSDIKKILSDEAKGTNQAKGKKCK